LVHFAFGTKYDLGDSSLRLMSAGTVIFMLNQYLFYVILSKKLEQKYITLIVTSTILQILMNLVLLPRIGIVGAASGMLVMGCVMHGGQLFLLKRVGFLSAGEVLRTEIFVAGAVSGIALSWSLYGGGLLAWGCAMVWVVCFSQVLIGVQDRVLVGNWLVKKRRALLQRFQRS
jgi:O-antigen/teichoic acid export membrane protein